MSSLLCVDYRVSPDESVVVVCNRLCSIIVPVLSCTLEYIRKATFTQLDDGCVHTLVESLTPKLCLCYVRFPQLIPTVYGTDVPQRRASSCAVMRGF